MTKRIATLLVPLLAACSGQLSMSGLLGGKSSSPASSTSSGSPEASSSSSSSSKDSGGESFSFSDQPGMKAELLEIPKFFQGNHMQWALSRGAWKAIWLADLLGDQLGETARMTLVHWCLQGKNDLAWAACTGDAHRLDRKRLIAELDAPEARKYRTAVLAEYDALVKAVAARDAEVAKRVKDDPALAQVFEVVPKATWKEWDQFSATDAPLLAIARKLEVASQKRGPMDDRGPSRKAYAGCIEQIGPAFTKVVNAAKISKETSLVDTFGIATTPRGYIATLANYYCARGQDLGIAAALGVELTKGSMLRGPRMATIEALLAKSKTLRFDDKAYSLENFVWRDANYINEDEQLYGETGGDHGVIKTVERRGDMLHITFAKAMIEYPVCDRSEPTNSWHYDASSGNLEQVYQCVKWGAKSEMQDIDPVDVPASQSAGVQAGRFLEYRTANNKAHSVRAVWDSSKQKNLIALYGVARRS